MRSTASDHRSTSLPATLAPRGLNREQAAEYVGIGTTLFDRLIADGVMPKPIEIGGRRVWDRWQLDTSFGALADSTATDDGADYWDKVKQRS
jgi:predicted DNA-binding transcriptional regulator AlpA